MVFCKSLGFNVAVEEAWAAERRGVGIDMVGRGLDHGQSLWTKFMSFEGREYPSGEWRWR